MGENRLISLGFGGEGVVKVMSSIIASSLGLLPARRASNHNSPLSAVSAASSWFACQLPGSCAVLPLGDGNWGCCVCGRPAVPLQESGPEPLVIL